MMTYNAATVLPNPQPPTSKPLPFAKPQAGFRNTPLSEVVKELERYHPVHIRLVDPSLHFYF